MLHAAALAVLLFLSPPALAAGDGEVRAKAEAFHAVGASRRRLKEFDDARLFLTQAAETYRQAGDVTGEAAATAELAAVESERGRHFRAWDLADASAGLFRRAGDRGGEALALALAGEAQVEAGAGRVGLHTLARARDIARAAGEDKLETRLMVALGFARLLTGNPREARPLLAEAARRAKAQGLERLERDARLLLTQAELRDKAPATDWKMAVLVGVAIVLGLVLRRRG